MYTQGFFLRINVSVATTQTNLHHSKRRNYVDLSGNVKSRPSWSPRKEAIEYAGWAPELVWTFRRREKYFAVVGSRILYRPARSLCVYVYRQVPRGLPSCAPSVL